MAISKESRQALLLAAANGFLVVGLGAFGAHILKQRIDQDMLEVFDTGVRYHMFHTLALLAVALLGMIRGSSRILVLSVWLFFAGIVLFSGSLYLLAITGVSKLGIITPLGGVAFLAGWALLFYAAVSAKHD